MQFKIPQNVQREDTIVGPLTLRQLIICGIGFMIDYGIYTSLAKDFEWITWILPVSIVLIITLLFAFIKPLDLQFSRYLIRLIQFNFIFPKKRYFIKGAAEAPIPLFSSEKEGKTKAEKKAEAKAEAVIDKRQKLEEIVQMLSSSDNHTMKKKDNHNSQP